MKKLIFAIVFFVVGLFCLTSFVDMREWSPSGRRAKHFTELMAQKNDTLFLKEYMNGFDYPKMKTLTVEAAIKIAGFNKDSSKFTKSFKSNDLAFKLLEKEWGVDSTAKYIYKLYNPSTFQMYWKELYPSWNSLIQNLENQMSPKLLESVKKLVKKDGLNDALWLKRYVSLEEIDKLITQNEQGGDYDQWKVKWEKWFFLSIVGDPMYSKFIDKISNKEIFNFHMITSISSERRWELFKQTDLKILLKYAHHGGNYFSGINNSEIRRLFFTKRNEWKKESINELFYFPLIYGSKEFLVELKSRPLHELINPGLTHNTDDWEPFQFYRYAEIVISKVNSDKDYSLAKSFFDEYDENGKGGWLALLNKKMLSL